MFLVLFDLVIIVSSMSWYHPGGKPKYEPVEINSSFDEISSDSQDSSSFEHWSIQPSPVKNHKPQLI